MRSSTWEIIIIRPGLFTNCKKFPENRSWKVTTIWVVPAENFQDQRNRLKCAPVFFIPDGIFQTEIRVHFLKAIFDTSFRPKQNAIPVRKWCGYAHAWGIGQASRACKCCWRRTRYKADPDQPKKSRKTIWPQITAQPINEWRKIFDFPKRISGFPMWMVSIPGQCPVAVLVVLALMVRFRFRRVFLGNGF